MQEAIPYRTTFHHSLITHSPSPASPRRDGMVAKMVADNAVIVVGRSGCCMCHVVKRLLLGLGVNPAVYDVEEKDEVGVRTELEALIHGRDKDEKVLHFPAVFIGGKLFGGLDRLMATHISGDLIPILKKAGALWL
ncbi:glutaredoxin-C9-like [Neltuma alba]|uniref:glutaredoxin-C9-like n=1 Tax=Neltuma alba TaxID=207710 RepID=UPI0010A2AC6E|nr:glutaredoxin-C9-like [Prosopis alba]